MFAALRVCTAARSYNQTAINRYAHLSASGARYETVTETQSKRIVFLRTFYWSFSSCSFKVSFKDNRVAKDKDDR